MTTILFYSILNRSEVEAKLDELGIEGLERLTTDPSDQPNRNKVSVVVQDDFKIPPSLQINPASMIQTIYYPESCLGYKNILLKIYNQLEDPVIHDSMSRKLSLHNL